MSGERVAVTLDEALREAVARRLADRENVRADSPTMNDETWAAFWPTRKWPGGRAAYLATDADAVLAVLREQGEALTEEYAPHSRCDLAGWHDQTRLVTPWQPTPSGEGTT